MKKILTWKNNVLSIAITTCFLIYIMGFALRVTAQDKRAAPGEMALCEVKVSNQASNNIAVNKGTALKKIYKVELNQTGFFDRVPNIKPLEIVPVTITYPAGIAGEKVLLSAEDGGKFENGRSIMAAQLNSQKKLVFNFQVSDQVGIFHITLRKGNDTKVVQLWVDSETSKTVN